MFRPFWKRYGSTIIFGLLVLLLIGIAAGCMSLAYLVSVGKS